MPLSDAAWRVLLSSLALAALLGFGALQFAGMTLAQAAGVMLVWSASIPGCGVLAGAWLLTCRRPLPAWSFLACTLAAATGTTALLLLARG